jgi:hypothetical protein
VVLVRVGFLTYVCSLISAKAGTRALFSSPNIAQNLVSEMKITNTGYKIIVNEVVFACSQVLYITNLIVSDDLDDALRSSLPEAPEDVEFAANEDDHETDEDPKVQLEIQARGIAAAVKVGLPWLPSTAQRKEYGEAFSANLVANGHEPRLFFSNARQTVKYVISNAGKGRLCRVCDFNVSNVSDFLP